MGVNSSMLISLIAAISIVELGVWHPFSLLVHWWLHFIFVRYFWNLYVFSLKRHWFCDRLVLRVCNWLNLVQRSLVPSSQKCIFSSVIQWRSHRWRFHLLSFWSKIILRHFYKFGIGAQRFFKVLLTLKLLTGNSLNVFSNFVNLFRNLVSDAHSARRHNLTMIFFGVVLPHSINFHSTSFYCEHGLLGTHQLLHLRLRLAQLKNLLFLLDDVPI